MRPHTLSALGMAAWVVAVAAMAGPPAPAGAAVTVFQQGVSPTPEYAGCVDTFIVGHGWAHDRPIRRPTGPTLSRPALMRFDISAIGKNDVVKRAVLRLSCASIPPQNLTVEVRTLTRAWDATATWYEHKYKDAKKTDENNWTKFGGDLDETDFGEGKPGLVAKATVRGGPFGHIVELDVTGLVAEWVSGKRPNYGLYVTTARGGFSVASSEWPMPAYRPALVIQHHNRAEAPKPGVKLELPPALGAKAKLSGPAGGAPAGNEPWKVVRFGRNSNCQYRAGHACGYAKQDPRYPGNWGWTPRLRVGGTAGDFNHAAFYFNLKPITKPHGDTEIGPITRVKVKRATLRVFVDCGNIRLPEDTMGQTPETIDERAKRRILNWFHGRARSLAPYSFGLFRITRAGPNRPPWVEHGFTFAQRGDGQPWAARNASLIDATEDAPTAVCHVGQQWKKLLAVRDKVGDTWLEWDVTAAVHRWVNTLEANYGFVIDGRLMGGAMTLLADDWPRPDRRPYLEVEVSPGPEAKPDGKLKPEPLMPAGDYWVEPMRKAHAKWKGTPGTFGQYGDSITITMAFWTPLMYGQRKGATPQMQKALDTAREYVHRPCWRQWKGGQWGNTGNMTIAWAFASIDAWQKKMNPEVAVILFGTNDVGSGPRAPIYTEMYAAVIDRMLADGTIPIVTTLPPHGRQVGSVSGLKTVLDLRQAAIAVAKQKKTPLIDFYTELVKRQPEEWRKLLVPDGLHPSYPKQYQQDWTEQGLAHSGYTLRNYLTLKTWYDIHQKVLKK